MIIGRSAVWTAVLLTSLTSYTAAHAQDACVALLQHGIYDRLRETSTTASASDIKASICESYNRYRQDRAGGSAQASYLALSGGASFSRDQIEAVGQLMCSGSEAAATAGSDLAIYQDKVSPDAATAFSSCVSQFKDGLRANTTFREDEAVVTIGIDYVPPQLNPNSKLTLGKVEVSPNDSFACVGDLASRSGAQIGHESVSMICTRSVAKDAFPYQGRRVYAVPATIVVPTNAGDVVRHLAAIPAGPADDRLDKLETTVAALNAKIIELTKVATATNAKFNTLEVAFPQTDGMGLKQLYETAVPGACPAGWQNASGNDTAVKGGRYIRNTTEAGGDHYYGYLYRFCYKFGP